MIMGQVCPGKRDTVFFEINGQDMCGTKGLDHINSQTSRSATDFKHIAAFDIGVAKPMKKTGILELPVIVVFHEKCKRFTGTIH